MEKRNPLKIYETESQPVVNLSDGKIPPQAIDLEDGPLSTSGGTKMAMYLLYHPPKFRLQKIKVTAEFLISELKRETLNF